MAGRALHGGVGRAWGEEGRGICAMPVGAHYWAQSAAARGGGQVGGGGGKEVVWLGGEGAAGRHRRRWCGWEGRGQRGGTVDGGMVLEGHPEVEPHKGDEHREKHHVQANGADEQHCVEGAGQPPE